MNVKELAQALGKELSFTVDTTQPVCPRLYTPGGGYLYLRLDERKGRLSIHGDYTFTQLKPDGTTGTHQLFPRTGDCTITVAASRPIEAIAREIENRCLPVYRALWTIENERNEASNKYELDSRETAALLSKAVGKTVSPARPGSGESSTYLGERRLEFYISGEEVYWLKASKLSREQAVKLIAFLKTI